MPKYTKPRKTWHYLNEFKVKAVQLSLLDNIQVKEVAETLDIHPFMLSRFNIDTKESLECIVFNISSVLLPFKCSLVIFCFVTREVCNSSIDSIAMPIASRSKFISFSTEAILFLNVLTAVFICFYI